jgi:hypothetical protein
MTSTIKYNGWTNYETWKANLEIFDNFYDDIKVDERIEEVLNTDTYEYSQYLKDYLYEILDFEECEKKYSALAGFAHNSIQEINFYEIAEHIQQSLKDELEYKKKGQA